MPHWIRQLTVEPMYNEPPFFPKSCCWSLFTLLMFCSDPLHGITLNSIHPLPKFIYNFNYYCIKMTHPSTLRKYKLAQPIHCSWIEPFCLSSLSCPDLVVDLQCLHPQFTYRNAIVQLIFRLSLNGMITHNVASRHSLMPISPKMNWKTIFVYPTKALLGFSIRYSDTVDSD